MKHLSQRRDTGPNFLFSTWPQVEWTQPPRVLVTPTGKDDTPRMQAAVNRLAAIGGGMVRLSAGDFYTGETVVIPENLFKDKDKPQ